MTNYLKRIEDLSTLKKWLYHENWWSKIFLTIHVILFEFVLVIVIHKFFFFDDDYTISFWMIDIVTSRISKYNREGKLVSGQSRHKNFSKKKKKSLSHIMKSAFYQDIDRDLCNFDDILITWSVYYDISWSVDPHDIVNGCELWQHVISWNHMTYASFKKIFFWFKNIYVYLSTLIETFPWQITFDHIFTNKLTKYEILLIVFWSSRVQYILWHIADLTLND